MWLMLWEYVKGQDLCGKWISRNTMAGNFCQRPGKNLSARIAIAEEDLIDRLC